MPCSEDAFTVHNGVSRLMVCNPTRSGNTEVSTRVLVVRAGALGDTLMITPLIRKLHTADPNREIDVLVSMGGEQLLASNEYISNLYTLRLRNIPYFLSLEKRALVRTLRKRDYGSAIVLESAHGYRQIVEQTRVPLIRSFRECPFDPAQHSIINNLACGGFTKLGPADLDMDLSVSPTAACWSTVTLAAASRPRIGIHAGYGPGSKKENQTERLRGWSPRKFIEVARALITKTGGTIILTGSAGDRPVCQEIARELPAGSAIVTAGNTTVQQLTALIADMDTLVSVDSGPAHIAAAVRTSLVVLWGPGILTQTRPVSSTTPIKILSANVTCSPCYGTPLMKECTRNICMEQIDPEPVISAALELLKKRG
jgi:ADP-heptose:LPS heptosyltransferase